MHAQDQYRTHMNLSNGIKLDTMAHHAPGLTTNLVAVSDTARSLGPTIFTTQGAFILPHQFFETLNLSLNSKISPYDNNFYVAKVKISTNKARNVEK